MARPKSPEGKRVLLAFKISEAQQAAYDTARGDVPMADWARSVLDLAAAGLGLAIIQPGEEVYPPAVVRAATRKVAKPAPQAAFSDPPVNPLPAPEREARRCVHAGRRVNGGWCTECQWTIEPGGKFHRYQRGRP